MTKSQYAAALVSIALRMPLLQSQSLQHPALSAPPTFPYPPPHPHLPLSHPIASLPQPPSLTLRLQQTEDIIFANWPLKIPKSPRQHPLPST